MHGYPTSLGGIQNSIPPRLYGVGLAIFADWVGWVG